jgi:hypothetical protein
MSKTAANNVGVFLGFFETKLLKCAAESLTPIWFPYKVAPFTSKLDLLSKSECLKERQVYHRLRKGGYPFALLSSGEDMALIKEVSTMLNDGWRVSFVYCSGDKDFMVNHQLDLNVVRSDNGLETVTKAEILSAHRSMMSCHDTIKARRLFTDYYRLFRYDDGKIRWKRCP